MCVRNAIISSGKFKRRQNPMVHPGIARCSSPTFSAVQNHHQAVAGGLVQALRVWHKLQRSQVERTLLLLLLLLLLP